jgi:ubiquinone/menaquinone biosynthesis C-methylase UbiE
MEPRLQRRVQRYGWDKAAAHYESAWVRQLASAQARLLALAAARPGERVLDVACGTGLVTFPLARAVMPGGRVLGTDLSAAMVEAARERAAAQGCANATFERMGAEELALEDDSFNLSVCSLGLMYVPDTLAAIRELHRVLRPGGRVAVLVWGQRARCGWAEIFPIVDARVVSEVCPLFFRMGGEGVLKGELSAAGFNAPHLERTEGTLHFASDTEACVAAFEGGPVALAYNRFDAPTREAVHADYLASIAAYRNGSGYEIPAEFVLATSAKAG